MNLQPKKSPRKTDNIERLLPGACPIDISPLATVCMNVCACMSTYVFERACIHGCVWSALDQQAGTRIVLYKDTLSSLDSDSASIPTAIIGPTGSKLGLHPIVTCLVLGVSWKKRHTLCIARPSYLNLHHFPFPQLVSPSNCLPSFRSHLRPLSPSQ